MEFILKAENITKFIKTSEKNLEILKDTNLEIEMGSSISIQGPSGSGKTTLWHLLAGLNHPNFGKVYFENKNLFAYTEDERADLRAKYMGFVFQNFRLMPALSALENVGLPLQIQALSQSIIYEKTVFWLEQVGLSHRLNHKPHELSGGEQQRVAIARAFITNPKIIFADEMTGNLDFETGNKMLDLIFNLNENYKTTLCMITHDERLSARCDKRYLLQEGKLYLL